MVTEDSRDRDDAGIVRCAGSRSRVVERIFGVRRRLARSLSGKAGGGKAGTHAVDEIRRYQAVARVRIRCRPTCTVANSPTSRARGRGGARPSARDISGAEELLGKLYELAQVASNDFEGFRTAAGLCGRADGRGLASARAEQGLKECRVVLLQSLGAEFLGIDLEYSGEARDLGQLHSTATALP
jgi:hypothetical protein